MFRDQGRAFSSDGYARCVSKKMIEKGWDLRIPEPERQFCYMPLNHSECLSDQDRCVRLMKARLSNSGSEKLVHAKAHREVIRRFGRFPTRNAVLERPSTSEEARFLNDEGGYGGVVNVMRAAS